MLRRRCACEGAIRCWRRGAQYSTYPLRSLLYHVNRMPVCEISSNCNVTSSRKIELYGDRVAADAVGSCVPGVTRPGRNGWLLS